jgi:hypothetical protein
LRWIPCYLDAKSRDSKVKQGLVSQLVTSPVCSSWSACPTVQRKHTTSGSHLHPGLNLHHLHPPLHTLQNSEEQNHEQERKTNSAGDECRQVACVHDGYTNVQSMLFSLPALWIWSGDHGTSLLKHRLELGALGLRGEQRRNGTIEMKRSCLRGGAESPPIVVVMSPAILVSCLHCA